MKVNHTGLLVGGVGGGAGERERGVRMTRFLARVIGKMARSYSKMGGPTEKQVWRKNRLLAFACVPVIGS